MSAEENKAHPRRGFRPRVRLSLAGGTPDLSGFKQSLLMLRAAFPDMRSTVEDLFAEGDKVADRMTWQATHQGELMGIPPTGNTVTGTEMHISRIAEGNIVERWSQGDNLGLMQQLGAVPPPGQGGGS
jgi:predicted ester cyclase